MYWPGLYLVINCNCQPGSLSVVMKKDALPLVSAFILIISLITAFYFAVRSSGVNSGKSISRNITCSFTLKNLNRTSAKNINFYAYAPARKVSFQECVSVKSSHSFLLNIDSHQNQLLHFEISEIPPLSSTIITIESKLKLYESPQKEKLSDLFLKPEVLVESDNSKIIKKAAEIAIDSEKEFRIFNWVKNNLSYLGYSDAEKGALYALEHMSGGCTEYMDLFTALLRSIKIPARRIIGYQGQNITMLKHQDLHNWSEFYNKGSWYLADCKKGRFMKHDNKYIIMKVIFNENQNIDSGFELFRTEGCEGISVTMNN